MGAAGAPEGGGRKRRSGRCEGGGGAVVAGREADERPKENGGRACSATVRHAGMCPAAAAELEYEYRPGQVLAGSVALYCFIRFRGNYKLIQYTIILSTYDC